MGLKTTDYKIEKTGIELSQAYALIGRLYMDKSGHAAADFHIQTDREKALNLEPLEVKTIGFTPARNGNLYEQAYQAAKVIFGGWEDDIVTEETEESEG
jgi:hypothetical protein